MRKLWRNKPILIAIIAIAMFLVLCAFTLGTRVATYAEGLFAKAIIPVQEFVSELTNDVTSFFVRVFTPSELEQKNAQLEAELNKYKLLDAEYEETSRENARLTEILNYVESNPNMTMVTAQVIARSSNEYVDTLTLNVGSRNGIKEKMPVVTPDGIVGRVTLVGTTWCKVRTMLNDDMRISVMVQRTRDEGMFGSVISNTGESAIMQLYYLPTNATVVAGDVILTSGLGGLFPKGMYVGEVVTISTGNEPYDAGVYVPIDFVHLEEVMIVLNVDEVVEE
ncbi:MAG: rod shape-determining protein MreC [Eubacteriales bacterium]|nr:rod shape-determining protein MreC [Eubacteriales bacterium]